MGKVGQKLLPYLPYSNGTELRGMSQSSSPKNFSIKVVLY